ncbi:crotonase/enoyl-CoA hydratase family protein [Oligoflexus tunisiensis]|uniref:crotonase/enoyl-CoA hydratase family protein n=1 Tax=Oligoflexus tunisiensis TaxID=708132 RepID=UPI000AC22F88|nr:crotonase/enoyl-CoA hydratase family protein [Oligoflexus tunisiensis]
MSHSAVSYQLDGEVATITMDDGKRNALSPPMFKELNEAIDQAERDKAIIVLTGRAETFSAGFDLKVMRSGGAAAISMLNAGYAMTARLLSFPRPVIAASSGHTIAMGLFLLLSSDYRIGAAGPYKYTANEVAIGLPMPRVVTEVMRLRLTPAELQRATILAATYTPEEALAAGMLDDVVPLDNLLDQANAVAAQLALLDRRAHQITKLRVRDNTLKAIRWSLPLDLRDALVMGVLRYVTPKKAAPV